MAPGLGRSDFTRAGMHGGWEEGVSTLRVTVGGLRQVCSAARLSDVQLQAAGCMEVHSPRSGQQAGAVAAQLQVVAYHKSSLQACSPKACSCNVHDISCSTAVSSVPWLWLAPPTHITSKRERQVQPAQNGPDPRHGRCRKSIGHLQELLGI